MYKVNLYLSPSGASPVVKFLDSCPAKLRVKILRQLKYVEAYGLNPAIPNIKKITGTFLWELRILGKDNVQIFCTSQSKKEIIVLHIFRKKKRKTPAKELNMAIKRFKEFDI